MSENLIFSNIDSRKFIFSICYRLLRVSVSLLYCVYTFYVNSRVNRDREINPIGNLILPFSKARFLLPAVELTRYDTLVETVYSSLDEGALGCTCGAATRLDFEEAAACCSDFLLLGSDEASGSLMGSLVDSGVGSGSADDSGDGSGSAEGSEVGSGSLAGSAALS